MTEVLNPPRTCVGVCALEHYNKFVAAHMRKILPVAHILLENVGNELEQLITGAVP